MVTFWAYLRFQVLLWALRTTGRVLKWAITAAVLIIAAPVTVVAAVAFAGAWLRGWPPAKLWRAAAWSLPMTGVYLAGRAVQARTWEALALAPVHDWEHAWHLTQAGHLLTAFVLCAPVAVPAALAAAGTAWAWRIYAIETGLSGRTATAPVVFDARQWNRQTRTARARITAPGTVPLTDGRGQIVMGATIRTVGHRWHPVLAVPAGAMGRHQVVIGASGSGKTNLMMRTWASWYASARTAHLGQGGPRPLLLVLDCKGGPDARVKAARTRRLLHAAGASRVAVWPDEAIVSLWGLPPRDLAVALFQMIETGTGDAAYYADITQAVLTLAITAPGGPPADGQEFLARLDATWLQAAHRDNPGALAAVRAARTQLPDIALRYRTLLSRLGPALDGPGDLADADAWYFILEGTREQSVAEAQALALVELAAALATSHDAEPRAILLACDDYSAVSGRVPLWQLYERGRSLGIGVQVSAQSWQGLGNDEDERYRIAATADGGLWLLRTPYPQPVCELAGTRRIIETATKVIGGMWGDEGSSRVQHAWTVNPQIARGLDTGQAAYIHGGGATWAQIARPQPSPLPLPPPPARPGASPVPVAFLGRTSTLVMQDPVASMRRQVRGVQAKLPPGWFIAVYYWDIESGGLDIEQRGHGTAHELFPEIGIPRDGGLADLLAEAKSPDPRFAVVMCEDIERSGRDTFNALKLEKELDACGVPLFATDEPIDVEGLNPTTVLVRRVKQGVAEWYRLQVKQKAWQGLREHALAGWNTGKPPYGYAAQGATKTRLVLDPARAPAVAQIFTWRAVEKAGIGVITGRLNADHDAYPPPKGDTWSLHGVYEMLANPKYTGYMVWNRYTNPYKDGRRGRRLNPPEQWVWSPEPSHPAIITRELYDAAQAIGFYRDSNPGEPGEPAHPLAQRTYELRSLVRHRSCKRRMCGVVRAAGAYYMCPHDMNNARHAAAIPDHPRTVTIREAHLLAAVTQFLDERIFGPERARLLAELLPATAGADEAHRQKQTTKLRRRLAQIDAAEHGHTREMEELATTSGPPQALAAMRRRHLERFTELETEREAIGAEIGTLAAQRPQETSPELLDALPLIPGILAELPLKLHYKLYQALDLQILYKHDTCQATCRATITNSTPHTVAAIIHDSHAPASDTSGAPRSDSDCVPGATLIV